MRRQRLHGSWYAIISLTSFSMLKIQSGPFRDNGDSPMGGLALNLVFRAQKLHIMMILALIISKLLRFQVFKSVASIGANANATCLVAGKSLELVLPRLQMKVSTGQENKLGYGDNKQDWTIRIFTKYKT